MRVRYRNLSFLVGVLILATAIVGCVDTFTPPEIEQLARYLVVDGSFNPGNDSSKVILSRTQNFYEFPTTPIAETGATVMVEGKNGRQLSFQETQEGVYVLGPQEVDQYDMYRLRIKTKAGKTYLSSYMRIMNAPEIDSITYEALDNRQNVSIKLNTHNQPNASRFYRWEYTETWEYNSTYRSFYEIYNKGTSSAYIDFRAEDIYTCWQSFKPTKLLVGSTAQLGQNLVQDLVLTTIPVSSGKLVTRYSILVKQFAMTQDEFDYWEALAKSTENTGSIFDPVPTSTKGNLYAVADSKEPVFGFFSVGKPSEKRLFIEERFGETPFCAAKDTVLLDELAIHTDSLIIEMIKTPGVPRPIFYRVISPECADCRLRGGTTRRPVFW